MSDTPRTDSKACRISWDSTHGLMIWKNTQGGYVPVEDCRDMEKDVNALCRAITAIIAGDYDLLDARLIVEEMGFKRRLSRDQVLNKTPLECLTKQEMVARLRHRRPATD